jgi:hypothetical protein
MTIDTSGNLGLGVTPSAWGGSFKGFQVGSGATLWSGASGFSGTYLNNNSYYNGTNRIYLQTGQATEYAQGSGQHIWYNAPSGTAGNAITFTQAMTLDTSGNLGIGTSSPTQKLDVVGAVRLGTTGTDTYFSFGANKDIYLTYGNSAGGLFMRTDDGAVRATLNNSGNLGLGVTPSAWSSSWKAVELAGGSLSADTGGTSLFAYQNTYFNGTSYIYKSTATASYYKQNGGIHSWYNAPSGTAGNAITFTQAMTLDNSGYLGIGTSSPSARLAIANSNTGNLALVTFSSGNGLAATIASPASGSSYLAGASAGDFVLRTETNNLCLGAASGQKIIFGTPSTEYARFDSSGNLLVGGTTQYGAAKLTITNGGAYIALNSTTGGYSLVRGFDGGTERWAIGQAAFGGADGMAFYTGSSTTERMRLDTSGNLLVGTTGTVYSGKIGVSFDGNGGAGSQGIALIDTNASLSGDYALFVNSSGNVAGRITHNGTTTVAYTTSSDYRLKEDIHPMTGALAKVSALKPVTYKWKDDQSASEGFIAHELAEVCPQAVVGTKDAVDEDGNPKYQGIDTSFLVATLTAALQEAHSLIKDLQTRVSQLEAK